MSDFDQWYPGAYFSRKIVPAEIQYKTYNSELLAIIETFKTWRYYLKDYKYEVFVLTNYNNFHRFIYTKSLSSRQVWLAQKLSWYHFWINYCQGKASKATNALSRFFQRNQVEEDELQTENTRIFHKLQFLLTNASFSSLSTQAELLLLHQVLICDTHVLPQLCQFWDTLQAKLNDKGRYKVSISIIYLKL